MKKQKDSQIKKDVKVEVGKSYVVTVKSTNSADILHEYTNIENLVYNIRPTSITFLKVVILIISLLIPPLLLITMPMMKAKNE